MAGSVNRAMLIGNVGGDPEMRNNGQGKPIVSFSLATSERWTKDGEKKERTIWHRIVIFNENLCRVAEKYVQKGSHILVEGKIVNRKYQGDDGKDRYVTEIVLDAFGANLVLLDKQEGGGNRPPPPEGADDYGTSSGRPQAERPGGGAAMDDDSIPFGPEVR